jgi:hypothetical protein
MLELAFSNQERFAVNRAELSRYLAGAYSDYYTNVYKAGQYHTGLETSAVTVEINSPQSVGFKAWLIDRIKPRVVIKVKKVTPD